MTYLLTAFLLGFAGSFHCVGMCGPIAMHLPVKNEKSKWKHIILYLAGKTITYTFLGLLFGLFGRQLQLAGLQQALSVAAGIILLVVVVMMLLNARQLHQNIFTKWVSVQLVPLFGRLQNKQGNIAFNMGLLNGLLPCGLVYMGIVGSLASGGALSGMLFMMAFGLGTMPVMVSFLLMAKQFNFNFRNRIKKLAPAFVAVMAILLIMRGLNLGIPFISPGIHSMQTEVHKGVVLECH